MAFKEFLKKHWADITIVAVAASLSIGGSIAIAASKKNEDLFATIYRGNASIMNVDLSKEGDERTFQVEGREGMLTIGVKKNAIAVLSSPCPRQYCVKQGYVSVSGHPIICAHSDIWIEIAGLSNEVVI